MPFLAQLLVQLLAQLLAPFLVSAQPYWKDQSYLRPAYYNSVDAALTVEGYEVLWGDGLSGGVELSKEQDLLYTNNEEWMAGADDDIPF